MEKIWSSLKIQFRNRFDFILYGQRIGYINIFTILIDFFILLYSVFDYRNLIHVDSIALLLFLIFLYSDLANTQLHQGLPLLHKTDNILQCP